MNTDQPAQIDTDDGRVSGALLPGSAPLLLHSVTASPRLSSHGTDGLLYCQTDVQAY